MTPQEKAAELIEKFAVVMPNENWKDRAIQCALIALEFAKNNYAIEDDYEEIESIKQEIIKL